MSQNALKVLAVVGSLNRQSATRAVLQDVADRLRAQGAVVDTLDFFHEPLALFNTDTTYESEVFKKLHPRVEDNCYQTN